MYELCWQAAIFDDVCIFYEHVLYIFPYKPRFILFKCMTMYVHTFLCMNKITRLNGILKHETFVCLCSH